MCSSTNYSCVQKQRCRVLAVTWCVYVLAVIKHTHTSTICYPRISTCYMQTHVTYMVIFKTLIAHIIYTHTCAHTHTHSDTHTHTQALWTSTICSVQLHCDTAQYELVVAFCRSPHVRRLWFDVTDSCRVCCILLYLFTMVMRCNLMCFLAVQFFLHVCILDKPKVLHGIASSGP